MPKCGNCSMSHETVADVRACYEHAGRATTTVKERTTPQWPASPKQINYVLGLQDERRLPDGYVVKTEDDLKQLNRDEVSASINLLKTFPKVEGTSTAARKQRTMPEGRYALRIMDSTDALKPEDMRHVEWRFYEVQAGKGRWDGYMFLKRLRGAPGQYAKDPVGQVERERIFDLIEADPKRAMVDYGLQSGVCGRCASPLTDPQSLARGIGPKCASKSGWDF